MAPLVPAAASFLEGADKKSGTGKMTLCLHQNTSAGAGYRKSLEGWAKAGIKEVELVSSMLDEFLKTEDLAAARKVVTDLGLTAVSCSPGLNDFWNPTPARAANMETLETALRTVRDVRHQEDLQSGEHDHEDHARRLQIRPRYHSRDGGYRAAVRDGRGDRIHARVGISFEPPNVRESDPRGRASERPRAFRFLPLLVGPEQVRRYGSAAAGRRRACAFSGRTGYAAGIADQRDASDSGRRHHADREDLEEACGEGLLGPLSVELFLPEFQQGDPFEVATKIREKATRVMRDAHVA